MALAIVMAALPAAQCLIHLLCRGKVDASLECSAAGAKNRDIIFTLRLQNRSLLPLSLYGRIVLENTLTGEKCTLRKNAFLPPRTKRQIPLSIQSKYCGTVTAKTAGICMTDVFSLIGVPCRCQAFGKTTVQPDTFSPTVHIESDANCPEDSMVYSDLKPGWDSSEPFRLREYVPGDSIRRIHWKLSGKYENLIVRDPSLPVTRSVVILWERYSRSTDRDAQDTQAEVVVSLCKALLEQSVQFTLAWNERDGAACQMAELRDMDDLVGVMPRILAAGAVTTGESAAELFCRMAGESGFSHLVYVADSVSQSALRLGDISRLTLLRYGADDEDAYGVLTFDRENYLQRLPEVVI